MDGYERTISEFIVEDVRQSVFYAPFVNFPPTVPEPVRQELAAKGKALVQDQVIPSYSEFYRFFTAEYMPHCRTEVGIISLDGGEDYYAYLIRYFTTTDMTPQAIHELGLSEARRIRSEMDAIITRAPWPGNSTCRNFAKPCITPPLGKAGDCTPRAWARKPALGGPLYHLARPGAVLQDR